MNNIKIFIFLLIQIMTINNAVSLGWNVRRIGSNKYELTIRKDNKNNKSCLKQIMNDIVSYDF